jgi:hypothetical protein
MPPEAERTAAEGDREVRAGKTFEKVETPARPAPF